MDHREEALRRLAALAKRADGELLAEVGVAAVHAILHVADTLKHGLRDIVYEMRS